MPIYCKPDAVDNSFFDYYYSSNDDSCWNDIELLCRNYDLAEVTYRESRQAFVATLMKQVTYVTGGQDSP